MLTTLHTHAYKRTTPFTLRTTGSTGQPTASEASASNQSDPAQPAGLPLPRLYMSLFYHPAVLSSFGVDTESITTWQGLITAAQAIHGQAMQPGGQVRSISYRSADGRCRGIVEGFRPAQRQLQVKQQACRSPSCRSHCLWSSPLLAIDAPVCLSFLHSRCGPFAWTWRLDALKPDTCTRPLLRPSSRYSPPASHIQNKAQRE